MIVDALFLFFFKQKTAYEMRSSDWSSDVCSSDLRPRAAARGAGKRQAQRISVVILDIIGPGDLLRPFGARGGAELVDGRVEQHFGARGIVVLDPVGDRRGEARGRGVADAVGAEQIGRAHV